MSSGIYKIANKMTGDFYIGSAVDIKQRFKNHKSELKYNRHPNIILQRVFNKYGLENLQFEIIETVNNTNKLIEIEQLYLDNLNPKYNILKIAGSRLGTKHSKETRKKLSDSHKGPRPYRLGFKHSEESKMKMSVGHTGKSLSEEHKRKIGKAGKGRKQSKEWIQKRVEAKAHPFKLKSPDNKIVEGRNIAEFCRNNNLSTSKINFVIHGSRHHHKGWTKI